MTASTTRTSHGPTINGLASLTSAATASNAPPTAPSVTARGRPVAAQMPRPASTRYPNRSGRRWPPTESKLNGAITSSAAAAYTITVRRRHSNTTSVVAAANISSAIRFCARSIAPSDGVTPSTRTISPASPRRTNPN